MSRLFSFLQIHSSQDRSCCRTLQKMDLHRALHPFFRFRCEGSPKSNKTGCIFTAGLPSLTRLYFFSNRPYPVHRFQAYQRQHNFLLMVQFCICKMDRSRNNLRNVIVCVNLIGIYQRHHGRKQLFLSSELSRWYRTKQKKCSSDA